MAVQIIRKTLYTLVALLSIIFLIIGASTRFSAEAMSADIAAFIKFSGPVLIALVCSVGVLEITRESLD
jgi:hypothetical protein